MNVIDALECHVGLQPGAALEGDLTPADLSGFAAQAALKELLANWREALADECQGNLVGDIDDVVAYLQAFKAKAQAVLPREYGGLGEQSAT